MMFLSTLLGATAAILATASAAPSQSPNKRATYPGFKNLESMFVFGDSWSRTGFDVTDTQPSSNPLGNPASIGTQIRANGPNWVEYLTTKYNQSLLLTYNFGTSGATLDSDLVASDTDVEDELNRFLATYPTDGVWTGDTTLFAIWVGVNDINRSYMSNYTTLNEKIFTKYCAVADSLYEAGARFFLLLNAPPLERSPAVTGFDTADVRIPRCAGDITDWNSRLESLRDDISDSYSDANVFHLDINTLFNDVIDDPAQFDQTVVYKDTKPYCEAYENGTDEMDTQLDECEYAANEYLWINSLHPTSPMHELVALKASELLG